MDETEFAAEQSPSPRLPQTQSAQRPPFSRQAIWGFVISCVSLLIFGFIGVMGVVLSSRGFRAATQGRARGRGLAIAGMIIGTVGFLYWVIVFIGSHFA